MNGVLVHSRKCDSHAYGQVGQLWCDNKARQTGVWQAVQSALSAESLVNAGQVIVSIQHCSQFSKHSNHAADMIRSWFPRDVVCVQEVLDDSSSWNFEISVNAVVLHSMGKQGHDLFHDNWDQQSFVWKAVKGLLLDGH